MTVILLSLATAVAFGTGDFFGGIATRRAMVIQVVAGSHLVGLLGVTVGSLALADSFRWEDFVLGAIGGAFGGLGVAFLYRRLAVGPMQVVAPLTAITSAVVPVAWGAIIGERLSTLVWTGIALGLVAIALVSWGKSPDQADQAVTVRVVGESLLAGCGFGAFFILLDATESSSAPWPVVGARVVTSAVLIVALLMRREPIFPPNRTIVALILATGLFDTAANVGFLLATLRGELAVVAVLTSLYPIATAALAAAVLGERMTNVQAVGFAGALGATTLIAAG
ncbi:MAG: EamA family transporter [Acidimicrobiales bacterium]